MTGLHSVDAPLSAGLERKGAAAAVGLTKWLCLAATPTFAILALLTSLDGSRIDRLCVSGRGPRLSGMVTMCVFHSPPWLNVIGGPTRNLRQ